MRPPLGRLRCLVLATWYGFDHVLGRALMKRSPDSIHLFDRSYLDFYYQRAYRRVWRSLVGAFLALGPRADRIIILRRDAAGIRETKEELSAAEIDLQYSLIRERVSSFPGYVEIDARGGVESTVASVLRLLNQ
jgi:hypothetical protein